MAGNNQEKHVRVNIRDINPLEHITADLAKSQSNFKSILNGLVTWNTTDNPNVTVRLATDSYPYFVDYTFPSRAAAMGGGGTVAAPGLPRGTFDYDNMVDLAATVSDEVTIRLNVADNNDGTWTLFEDAIVYDEQEAVASRHYLAGNYMQVTGSGTGVRTVRVATVEILPGTQLDDTNTRPAVTAWNAHDYASYDDYPGLVTYLIDNSSGTQKIYSAYVLRGASTRIAPDSPAGQWDKVAESIESKAVGTYFDTGMMYIYAASPDFSDAALYMYVGEPKVKTDDTSVVPLDSNGKLNADWVGPLVIVPVADIYRSTVLHHVPTTDINGFIMRSNSHEVSSVSAVVNLAVHEGTSEPHKGLKVFRTSNYVMWPENEASVWLRGTDYSDSDSYTAKMVFHHASDDVKMCNIVNYDGPDLDHGLAIYLPADDRVAGPTGESAYVEARDGAVFEFMFRIWPDTSYNGAGSPDLIINKAQIYVYSVRRSDELDSAKVLAKFSMARLTNFYLWAENVAVPNRPVFYKAKFIYSRQDKEWRTYDYYQVPDHVFLSPKGFVDPSLHGGIAGDSYGEDGPFTGVQTAGFPLMQDPFGGMDMSPMRLNRIADGGN